jgi:hypothetical protein
MVEWVRFQQTHLPAFMNTLVKIPAACIPVSTDRRQLRLKTGTLLAAMALAGAMTHAADVPSGDSGGIDAVLEEKFDWDKAREHWAFRPPTSSVRPAVKNGSWPSTRLDYFTLHKMEESGLAPAAPGQFTQLLRRVTFDLTGLPPDPDVFRQIPEEPGQREEFYHHYVSGLLNSHAFGERMASFWLNLARYAEDQAHQVGNDTKHFYPNAWRYRSWVIESFNSDRPYNEFINLQLAADFIDLKDAGDIKALGFLGLGPKYYNRGRLEVQADEWEDRVDTVTRTFLGLTVACARCHDHKYDPITIEDYYSLAGVFASTDMVNQQFDEQGRPVTEEEKKARTHEIHVVKDGRVRNLPVFRRGQTSSPGPETPRRFLRVLHEGTPKPFTEGSGRLELAEEISSPDNPLAARVYVNRIWALLFGRGLVDTPSNFGELGSRPTHPRLLDDLAVRFMESGWSTKWLIREIVFSSTYRQSATATAEVLRSDPENRLLSRMTRKRLPVEMWRDAVLKVSGLLDRSGKKSFVLSEQEEKGAFRRTVYSRISRLELDAFLMQFDYPDANVHSADRAETITPTQKLYAMNDNFFLESAASMARKLLAEYPPGDPEKLIQRAFLETCFRLPEDRETRRILNFLEEETIPFASRVELLVHTLLISNEMIYLD